MKTTTVSLMALLILTSLPASAQECGTIYWASQGNREKYHHHGDEVVYRAGGGGILRIYYQSRSESPYTLITHIGHPWDFGLEGQRPAETRNVVRMKPQNQQQISNGKINLQIGQPGATWVGYQIVGAYRKGVLERIPPRCRTDKVLVRVVARGQGNQGYAAPEGNALTGTGAPRPNLLGGWRMSRLVSWLRSPAP